MNVHRNWDIGKVMREGERGIDKREIEREGNERGREREKERDRENSDR